MASILITSALASGQMLYGYMEKKSRSSRDMAMATFLYSILCIFYILEPQLPKVVRELEVFIIGFKVLFIYQAMRRDLKMSPREPVDLWILIAALPVGMAAMYFLDFRTQQFMYSAVVLYYFAKAFVLALRNRKQVPATLYGSMTVFLVAYPMVFVVRSVYFLFRMPTSEFYSLEAASIYTTTILLFLYTTANVGVHIAATMRKEQELEVALDRVVEEKDFATDLVTIIGHDLRGFLGSIRGAAGASQNSGDPALKLVESNADRAEALLTDLVYWGRSRNDTKKPAGDIISVSTVMKAAENDIRIAAEARGVRLVLSPGSGLARGDSNALRVVMRNLMSNAIKFSGKGGEVEISAADTGEAVRITVSDSGPGMSPELTDQVIGGQYVRSKESTGTGLNIVTSVCHAAGWPMSIDSVPGEGTRISFDLPAVEDQ